MGNVSYLRTDHHEKQSDVDDDSSICVENICADKSRVYTVSCHSSVSKSTKRHGRCVAQIAVFWATYIYLTQWFSTFLNNSTLCPFLSSNYLHKKYLNREFYYMFSWPKLIRNQSISHLLMRQYYWPDTISHMHDFRFIVCYKVPCLNQQKIHFGEIWTRNSSI